MTSFRTCTPSSPGLVQNFMNFRFNHLSQRNVRPGRLGDDGAFYGTQWTTPNANGRASVSANAQTGQPLGGEGNDFMWPPNDPGATEVNK